MSRADLRSRILSGEAFAEMLRLVYPKAKFVPSEDEQIEDDSVVLSMEVWISFPSLETVLLLPDGLLSRSLSVTRWIEAEEAFEHFPERLRFSDLLKDLRKALR